METAQLKPAEEWLRSIKEELMEEATVDQKFNQDRSIILKVNKSSETVTILPIIK
jgi:hypothetical protein